MCFVDSSPCAFPRVLPVAPFVLQKFDLGSCKKFLRYLEQFLNTPLKYSESIVPLKDLLRWYSLEGPLYKYMVAYLH